jgi:hypothetical protein
MRRLLGAESLAVLDPESLFYLTWRWAYLTASIPADEAYKLEKAFDVDLGHLCRPRGFARQFGSNFALLGPQDRKGLKLSISPPLIDVLQLACQLWDAGRRRELEEMLVPRQTTFAPLGMWCQPLLRMTGWLSIQSRAAADHRWPVGPAARRIASWTASW